MGVLLAQLAPSYDGEFKFRDGQSFGKNMEENGVGSKSFLSYWEDVIQDVSVYRVGIFVHSYRRTFVDLRDGCLHKVSQCSPASSSADS